MASDDLDEKDFIQEGYSKDPSTLWLFLIVFLAILGLVWFLGHYSQRVLSHKTRNDPFLQVTNREFSLFLWQHPEFMKGNRKSKVGYLPDFLSDEVRVVPHFADQLVIAPDNVLFRYHVWKRLIYGSISLESPVATDKFEIFLQSNSEWLPSFWEAAPAGYVKLVHTLSTRADSINAKELPFDVRLAYQGWKNYSFAREKIQSLHISKREIQQFVEKHPHYGQSYFINMIPGYLEDQFPYFFKEALFRYSTVTNPSS